MPSEAMKSAPRGDVVSAPTTVAQPAEVKLPDALVAKFEFGPNAGDARDAELTRWQRMLDDKDIVHPYPDMDYFIEGIATNKPLNPFDAPKMLVIEVTMRRMEK